MGPSVSSEVFVSNHAQCIKKSVHPIRFIYPFVTVSHPLYLRTKKRRNISRPYVTNTNAECSLCNKWPTACGVAGWLHNLIKFPSGPKAWQQDTLCPVNSLSWPFSLFSADLLPKSVESVFIFQEATEGESNTTTTYDAIVVEQWTVIDVSGFCLSCCSCLSWHWEW